MKDKVFYQDFLMDIPLTKDEFPNAELQYVEYLEEWCDIHSKYNLFDTVSDVIRTVSFQMLHDLLEKDRWCELFELATKCNKIIIIDDIKVINEEVLSMKDFYLKVYYLNFKKYNSNTYIATMYKL